MRGRVEGASDSGRTESAAIAGIPPEPKNDKGQNHEIRSLTLQHELQVGETFPTRVRGLPHDAIIRTLTVNHREALRLSSRRQGTIGSPRPPLTINGKWIDASDLEIPEWLSGRPAENMRTLQASEGRNPSLPSA